ncbi:MAG: hypothetical protein QOE14_24 [Humisphaera sp.]|nr:hypothetical protein [Humisphaera sp.]
MRTVLVACLIVVSAQVATGDLIVNDFERDTPPAAIHSANLKAIESSDGDAAEGKSYLQLTPSKTEANVAQLRLVLPAGTNPAGRERFSAAVRAPVATEKIELRWYALDAKNRPLFQRRFDLAPGEKWIRLDEPLRTWRWDNRRMGDWDEVASIAVVVATPNVARIDLDDVRFTGQADEKRNADWLLDVAFADRPRKVAHADGLLVATDAVDAFAQADVDRLLANMRHTRVWLRKTFADADRPTDDLHAPAALLIFKDSAEYPHFYERLGAQWRVEISAPKSQGYTVQDIATSTYDPKLGPRRPVYFHESVHAVAARELRLLSGNPAHAPMQEGIANFLQVSLFPKSLPRAAYVKNFAQPIDASGDGFFKPLEMLFAKPVTTKEYAQLASVVAFLVERDEKLLRALATGLADGETTSDALARHGTTWREFEDAWFAWGKEKFRDGGDEPVFAPPVEFR